MSQRFSYAMNWWHREVDYFLNSIDERMRDGENKHRELPEISGKDYLAALKRHVVAIDAEDESENHYAAVACNAMILARLARLEKRHEKLAHSKRD